MQSYNNYGDRRCRRKLVELIKLIKLLFWEIELIKRPALRSENSEISASGQDADNPIAKSYPREGFLSNLHKEQKFHFA